MTTERRYRVGDRVVGHAWAAPRYRMRLGTISHVFPFTVPRGFKAYQVRWTMEEGQEEYAWHDERELSPLRKDDDDSRN